MRQNSRFSVRNVNTNADLLHIYRDPASQKFGKDKSLFVKFPDIAALDTNLSDREYRILDLLHRAWRAAGTNPIKFNLTSFAKMVDRSRRQVTEIIGSLEEKGYVSRAVRDGDPNSSYLMFRGFTDFYSNRISQTIGLLNGDFVVSDKPSKRREEILSGTEILSPPESDGREEILSPPERKSSHPLRGNPLTYESPNTETPSLTTDPVTELRHGECERERALRSLKKKQKMSSSLRSEDVALRAPCSHSLRSHSPLLTSDEAVSSPSATLEGREKEVGVSITRSLPEKRSDPLFDKDEDTGEQYGLFGRTKKKTASGKFNKKSTPKKATSRHNELGATKTKRKSRSTRKTPDGCCTPGEALVIFNTRLARDFPNTPISKIVDGKIIGQLAKNVSGYTPEVVSRMVDLLFDDWTAFKNKVWPKPTEGHPVIDHLWCQAKTLATYLETGIKDGSSRVSKHSIREKGAAETYKIPDVKALYREKFGSNES